MKSLVILFILFLIASLWGLTSGFWLFDRTNYLSEKALAISAPFSVKLDVELVKSLKPAL